MDRYRESGVWHMGVLKLVIRLGLGLSVGGPVSSGWLVGG